MPEKEVTNYHEQTVGKIWLDEDYPATIQAQVFKNIQRTGKICRVNRVPELVFR